MGPSFVMTSKVVESWKLSVSDLAVILLTLFKVFVHLRSVSHLAVMLLTLIARWERAIAGCGAINQSSVTAALLFLTLYSNTLFVSSSAVAEANGSYYRQRSRGWNRRRLSSELLTKLKMESELFFASLIRSAGKCFPVAESIPSES